MFIDQSKSLDQDHSLRRGKGTSVIFIANSDTTAKIFAINTGHTHTLMSYEPRRKPISQLNLLFRPDCLRRDQ